MKSGFSPYLVDPTSYLLYSNRNAVQAGEQPRGWFSRRWLPGR